MNELFLKILNMSISASWLICVIFILRVIFKKAPKWMYMILWGIVAIRLVCPFSIESVLSMIPKTETVSPDIISNPYDAVHTGINAVNTAINPIIAETAQQAVAPGINMLNIYISLFTTVWVGGIFVMLLYMLISCLRIRKSVDTAVLLKDNIYQSDGVGSPFVLGIIKPKIYLPFNINDESINHIIAHEQMHIKRRDHWWKPFGFLLLCIYWFNPLMWIGYALLCRDIELACDEEVIKKFDNIQRADYSSSLLSYSANRRKITACPLAFGESDVKKRVKSILNYKKPSFWIVIAGIVVCSAVCVCFLTNPPDENKAVLDPFPNYYSVNEVIYDDGRYSFGYTEQNAPFYNLTKEYGLRVARDVLQDSSQEYWVSEQGKFQNVVLSYENFDKYFIYDDSGWLNGQYSPDNIRKNTKEAWRLDVENSENGVFYYVISTNDGSVFLSYGYSENEGDTSIRWLFELEKMQYVTCNVVTDMGQSTVVPVFYPDSFDFDYNDLPCAEIENSAELIIEPNWDTDTLVIGEDYYKNNNGSTQIERKNYTLQKNGDKKFHLTLTHKNKDKKEEAVYYIEGPEGKYVIKVSFLTNVSANLSDFSKLSGMTFVSYQCLYMNPLSSVYPGGDTRYRYIIGDKSFILEHRVTGEKREINDITWKWEEFPYTDEEWEELYSFDIDKIKSIRKNYKDLKYQPLENDLCLIKADNNLLLAELKNNKEMGTFLWSIYSLVPEGTMGTAEWIYSPLLSSRIPVFRFEFDMEYKQINAVCEESMLVDWDNNQSNSDNEIILKEGNALYWSPLDENGSIVSQAEIYFTVNDSKNPTHFGTIYITCSEENDAVRKYTASLSSSEFYLEQNTDTDGAILRDAS